MVQEAVPAEVRMEIQVVHLAVAAPEVAVPVVIGNQIVKLWRLVSAVLLFLRKEYEFQKNYCEKYRVFDVRFNELVKPS